MGSTLRKLQRNAIKNQHTSKEDDSGGAKNGLKNKPKYFNDNKSTTKYLKATKAYNNVNAQNKANVGVKSKVC